jgi:mannosyltransferase OCH1-like enzyme
MIPKIIHCCWLSDDAFPEDTKKYMETWKKRLIDYKILLWNSKNFNINDHLWVKQAFEVKKYAFAADYIKFHSLYNYGGIYLDSDVEVIKPFDDLLDTNILLAYENDETKEIEGGIFGAEKNSAFIKSCLDYYHNLQFIKPDGSYDMRVLPQIMKEMVENTNNHVNIYPSEYFTANHWETGIINITNNTHTIHHFAGSWLPNSQRRRTKFIKFIYKLFGKKIGANISEVIVPVTYSLFSKITLFSSRVNKTGYKNAFKYYIKKYLKWNIR